MTTVRVASARMEPETLHILDYLTPEEVIEAYEKLHGVLPEPRECAECGQVYVVTEGGRRSTSTKFHSRRCAQKAAERAYHLRQHPDQPLPPRLQ